MHFQPKQRRLHLIFTVVPGILLNKTCNKKLGFTHLLLYAVAGKSILTSLYNS